MIIDAHHHVWTADYAWLADASLAAIRRDYTVEDLRPHLRAAGIEATILVEAGRCEPGETAHFLALAAATPEIAAVVGWAALTDPALPERLAEHRDGAGGRYLAGVRDQIQAYPVDFLDRAEVRAGLRAVAAAGLVNEVVVRADQLPSVVRAADALPDSVLVLDHLGKPPIAAGTGALPGWRRSIAALARRPQVLAKLSGLVTEADWALWTVAELRPWVETALELFGPERLMFGSDWPVCEVAAGYGEVVEALTTILGGRPAEIFGGTAARTYLGGVGPR
jgi:L-fucono-1,5-lactonase